MREKGAGLRFLLRARLLRLAPALARRFLSLPLADGGGVGHDDFVHPGEGLWEQHRPLEEAQVAPVQRQRENRVGLLFCKGGGGDTAGVTATGKTPHPPRILPNQAGQPPREGDGCDYVS